MAKKKATSLNVVKKSTQASLAKGAAGKSASAKSATQRKKSNRSSSLGESAATAVTIRMYCQGLGDCFLLQFPRKAGSGEPVNVMIDCGVILGTEDAGLKMDQVVDDIIATTNGKIDLLIVTHEHWDHLSGFVQAREKFQKKLRFEAVWLAWTEKPGHPVADKLRRERKAKLKSLRAAITGLRGLGMSKEIQGEFEAVDHLLGFFGPVPKSSAALAATGDGSTEEAMGFVASLSPEFLSPGDISRVPETEVRAYVLGPPLNEKLLKKDSPGKNSEEAYELMSALTALAAGDDDEVVRGSPFATRYQVSNSTARVDPFFRSRYGFDSDALGAGAASWRRIDEVWLEGTSRLALKLDSDTNNTSLALAFELPDGRTLIFPGDAQIGNWLSWQTVDFPVVDGRKITSQDLLNRAVVYKVGHHCSHNATLKAGGLEEMTSGKLVALIPVNQEMANKKRPPKTGWKMPFKPLHDRLRELTGGCILRADRGPADLDDVEQSLADDQQSHWKRFRKQVRFSEDKLLNTEQPLYVEYTVPDR